MPKRVKTKTRRVDAKEVQGDDSWVEITSLTVEQANNLRLQMSDLERNLNTLKQSLDPQNDSRRDYEAKQKAIADAERAFNEFAVDIASQYAVQWNWVDDDDIPLPQPAEGGIERLWMSEFKWLTQQIMGGTDEKKG